MKNEARQQNGYEKLVEIYLNHHKEGELLLEYIELAKKAINFENGFISYIEDQYYEVIQSSTLNNKLKSGAVFKTCDTLCEEVVINGKPIYHCKLIDTPLYNLPGRAYLDTESVIGLPLVVEGEIWGTLTLCSTSESDEDLYLNNKNFLDLISMMVAKIIQNHKLRNKLKASENLLKMGEEFLEIATYKRFLNNDQVESTSSFFDIFNIPPIEEGKMTTAVANMAMSKVIDADKLLVQERYERSKTEDVPAFEYRIAIANNKVKWLRHKLKYVGESGYVLGVIQDISDLKQTELKLKSKNEELEQFAYATAHDLQEPLRTITGFIDVLEKKTSENSRALGGEERQYLNFIKSAATRMKNQIDGLLDHSRIGRRKEKLSININLLLSDIVEDLQQKIKETSAIIDIADMPIIKGYKMEMRLLFLNLLTNALKFSRRGIDPHIQVRCKEEDVQWVFSVKDNGLGIADEHKERIFKIFIRLKPREDYEGTGIGLAQVKKIVDLHNGDVQVDSKLGSGSTFRFTIKK